MKCVGENYQMKTIKNSIVYIPLIATVLFIAIGIAVLIANQPNEIKANTSGESIGFIENNAGNDPNLAGGTNR